MVGNQLQDVRYARGWWPARKGGELMDRLTGVYTAETCYSLMKMNVQRQKCKKKLKIEMSTYRKVPKIR